MQTRYNHFEYGERLARSLKPISHTETQQQFFRATEVDELQELNARLSSTSGMVLVAIDGSNSDFDSKDSDNLVERPQYFFVVLENAESGDVERVFSAQQHCKLVAMQIINRLILDHQAYRNGLACLDDSSFTLRGVGPAGDNFYGVILGFNLLFGRDCRLDPNLWNEDGIL